MTKIIYKVLKTFHNNSKTLVYKNKKNEKKKQKHTHTTLCGFSSCPNQLSCRISQICMNLSLQVFLGN